MISVWLIDGFRTHQRHARCIEIWNTYAHAHPREIVLNWVNNLGIDRPKLDHDEVLEEIWYLARRGPADFIIITEPDFLPGPGFAVWPDDSMTMKEPIQAAEYVTRDAQGALHAHGLPGAWCVRIARPLLLRSACLHFRKSGPFNDPCNTLHAVLQASTGGRQGVRLLPQVCRRPHSFGVETPGVGTHLFWSRHYGDDPNMVIGGIRLGEVFEGVDRELATWTLA